MNKPCVSIGMPVYNGEAYIREAIDSILAQTFQDFELIISDNASTDSSESICQEYAVRDPRIRYYRQPQNYGPAWNYNYVFEVSNGKYFKWAAHDDLCAPEFLERCIEKLDQDQLVVLCYSQTRVINEKGEVVENYDTKSNANSPEVTKRFRDLLFNGRCYEIFGLIRSDALKKTSLIENYAHGDGILLIKLGLLGRFYHIPEYLFISRRHARQSVAIAQADYRQYTAWFDPSKIGHTTFPRWKQFYEYCSIVWTAPISWRQRLYCFTSISSWVVWKRRRLLEELYHYLHSKIYYFPPNIIRSKS